MGSHLAAVTQKPLHFVTKLANQTKMAARRLPFKIFQAEAPMEVEEVTVTPVLPPGVKDIDVDDHENPQLCAEYALETYAYLKQLEKRGAVPLIIWLDVPPMRRCALC